MINFRSPFTIAIILILVIIAGAMIGKSHWFNKLLTPSKVKEGTACTDSNGNPSTIVNGVCKEVVKDNTGADQQQRISQGPDTMRIIRVPYLLPQQTVVMNEYPETTYKYTGQDKYYFYYQKS